MLLHMIVFSLVFFFHFTNKVGEVALNLPTLITDGVTNLSTFIGSEFSDFSSHLPSKIASAILCTAHCVITLIWTCVRIPYWTILGVCKLISLLVRGTYCLVGAILWYSVWTPLRFLLYCLWLLLRYGLPYVCLALLGFFTMHVGWMLLCGNPVAEVWTALNLTLGQENHCPY